MQSELSLPVFWTNRVAPLASAAPASARTNTKAATRDERMAPIICAAFGQCNPPPLEHGIADAKIRQFH